jgi:hypothetical protein
MTNKYTYDGIWLMKDGQPSICPRLPGTLAPTSSLTIKGNNPVNLEIRYLTCNKQCPFHRDAVRKEEGKPDIKGIALMCMEKQLFLEISEAEKTEISTKLTISQK